MRGLEEKVIVVAAGGTGATDGTSHGASIGGATSRRLAQEGALVVVGDIDEGAAKRTVGLIEADGGKAVAHQFDAGEDDQIKSLMDRAIGEFGGIDGVHYNAMDMSRPTLGVDGEHDLLTLPLEAWQRTLDVGLTGMLLAARHSIPTMLERGGGARQQGLEGRRGHYAFVRIVSRNGRPLVARRASRRNGGVATESETAQQPVPERRYVNLDL